MRGTLRRVETALAVAESRLLIQYAKRKQGSPGEPAIEVLFGRFDAALLAAGFLPMSGQIIDASMVAAPKQRNTDGEA